MAKSKTTPEPVTGPKKKSAKAAVKTSPQKKTKKPKKADLPPKESLKCSFCGKPSDKSYRLIAGPASVCICDECVEVCVKILSEECPYYWHGRLTAMLDNIMGSLKEIKLLPSLLAGPRPKAGVSPQQGAAPKKQAAPSKSKPKGSTPQCLKPVKR